jgi:hypothetical protein
LVVEVRSAPVSTLLAVTVARGTGAPEESVIIPEMLPETWAFEKGTAQRMNREAARMP